MPSLAHQHLLLWVARKMTGDGIVLTGFDGPAPYGGAWNDLPRPFTIAGVRCDASGVVPDTGEIALGEAKTAEDLASEHSRRQLRVFGGLVSRHSKSLCRLYIAVPRSAVYELDRALIAAGLVGASHVIRLHIPDVMLEETCHVARHPPACVPSASAHWH
jgi:hypothetical protein